MPLKLNPDELPTFNLTSMIDVVFLLLIFFMVSTRFSETESALQVDLPRVSAQYSASNPPQSKTINLYRDGAIELDNQRMSLSDLTRTLGGIVRANSQINVFIRSDGSLPVQKVMEVMDATKKAGVQRLSLNGQSNWSR